jgi:hypothetical protein
VVNNKTQVQYEHFTKRLVVFDNIHSRLVLYDEKTNRAVKKISFHDSNKRKASFTAFYYAEPNKIILYNYSAKEFYLATSNGNIIKTLKVKYPKIRQENLYHGYPRAFIQNSSPIYFDGNFISCTGYLFGEHDLDDYKNRFVRLKVNINTGQTSFDINYPSSYFKGNWGGDYFRIPYTTLTKSKNLLISFPAEHKLIQVSPDNTIKQVHGSDNSNSYCISSMDYTKEEMLKFENDTLAHIHYSTSYSYKNIIQYSDEYYIRMLELPVARKKLNKYGSGKKDVVLIILNKAFDQVGMYRLPSELSADNYYVTENGVFFLNTNNENEDQAIYTQLTIISKN